jgi:hypothetical protein
MRAKLSRDRSRTGSIGTVSPAAISASLRSSDSRSQLDDLLSIALSIGEAQA